MWVVIRPWNGTSGVLRRTETLSLLCQRIPYFLSSLTMRVTNETIEHSGHGFAPALSSPQRHS